MNINFTPNGNTRMTLRNPTSVNSKVMGFGRPAIIPERDEPFTAVYSQREFDDFGSITITFSNQTTAAADETTGDVTTPYYATEGPIVTVDRLYIGFAQPFNAVRLQMSGVANPSEILTWKYATPVQTAVSNIQETAPGLKNMKTTTEGKVYWDMPNDWILTQPSGSLPLLYWITIESTYNYGIEVPPGNITRILKTTPP